MHGWQIGRKNHGKKPWEKGKQSGGERKDDEGEGCRKKDQGAEVVFRRDQDPGRRARKKKAGKTVKSKKGNSKIGYKLILAFCVPVLLIVALGTVSYNLSAKSIKKQYGAVCDGYCSVHEFKLQSSV